MADTKISDLTLSNSLSNFDYLPISRSGANFKLNYKSGIFGCASTGDISNSLVRYDDLSLRAPQNLYTQIAYADSFIGSNIELRQNSPTKPGIDFISDLSYLSRLYVESNTFVGEWMLPATSGTIVLKETVGNLNGTLSGFSNAYGGDLSDSDTIVGALGKLENKIQNVFYANIGGTISSDTTISGRLSVDKLKVNQLSQNYQASTVLDFNNKGWVSLSPLTGNITLSTSNRAEGYELAARIIGGTGAFNFTFPSWVFVGGIAPTSIAAGKTGILSLRCFGSAETDIIASYAVQS